MAKKTGKVILWGLVVGASAAAVYHYLQNKDKAAAAYDEFDDFDNFEDVKEETAGAERNYVPLNLDEAKIFVSETLDKAKEAISKVSKNFHKSEENDIEIIADDISEDVSADTPAEDNTTDAPAEENSSAITEEFFDDNDEQ
ncbi:MAG: hypothetical protein ACI4DW_00510 [Lachnospiraceae bacterium]